MPAGPGGSGGQGRYRPGRPQVGRPRDLDGRPRGEGERRGGRTFRPGLHDWTPGASSGASGAAGTGAGNKEGRGAGAARQRAAYRPQGAPGNAAQRQRQPERRVVRPGSMGPAAPSGERTVERGDAAPVRGGQPRGNRGAPTPGAYRPGPGIVGGRTRLGSDEPRDAGDRSRYRLRSGNGYAEARGERGPIGNGAAQGAVPRSRPPYASGVPQTSPAAPRGRHGGPRPRFEGSGGPRGGPGRSGYADLDQIEDLNGAASSGDDFPFPAVGDHDVYGFSAASPPAEAAPADFGREARPSARPARNVRQTRSAEQVAHAAPTDATPATAPVRRRRRAADG